MADYISSSISGESQTPENKNEDQGYKPGKKIPAKKAIPDLIKGLVAGSLAFIVAFLIMSIHVLTVPYILRSFIAMGFAFLVIKSYDKTSGEVPTSINIAVASAVIMLFTLSLIWGYNTNKDAKSETDYKTTVVFKSESFSFTGQERWATEVTFPAGKEYKITVEGASVNLISSTGVLELTSKNSPYIFRTNSEGSPTFDGIEHGNGARSNVKVEWQD